MADYRNWASHVRVNAGSRRPQIRIGLDYVQVEGGTRFGPEVTTGEVSLKPLQPSDTALLGLGAHPLTTVFPNLRVLLYAALFDPSMLVGEDIKGVYYRIRVTADEPHAVLPKIGGVNAASPVEFMAGIPSQHLYRLWDGYVGPQGDLPFSNYWYVGDDGPFGMYWTPDNIQLIRGYPLDMSGIYHPYQGRMRRFAMVDEQFRDLASYPLIKLGEAGGDSMAFLVYNLQGLEASAWHAERAVLQEAIAGGNLALVRDAEGYPGIPQSKASGGGPAFVHSIGPKVQGCLRQPRRGLHAWESDPAGLIVMLPMTPGQYSELEAARLTARSQTRTAEQPNRPFGLPTLRG